MQNLWRTALGPDMSKQRVILACRYCGHETETSAQTSRGGFYVVSTICESCGDTRIGRFVPKDQIQVRPDDIPA